MVMDLSCSKMCSVIVTRANVDDSHQEKKRNKRKRLPFPNNFVFLLHGILLFLLLPESSFGYYVGPEIGTAPGETRVLKSWGAVPNATSLAEAAYVPQVYAIGNNAVILLRSLIPALQPKVDFFAEQIQDTIDTANTKLMQKLENSNNGILAMENFFTGLMKAVVFGKGPEDDEEEKKRRIAMRLIRSGGTQDSFSSSSTTTTTSTTSTTTTSKPTTLTTTDAVIEITTGLPILQRSTTSSNKKESNSISAAAVKEEEISTNLVPPKVRDNNFNKMKLINFVKSMIQSS